jgi:hypothetical protein
MESTRLWKQGNTADQIALLAVYFPVIRTNIERFINRWNKHKIRHQNNRPNSVRGRVWENYFTPNPDFVQQWGLPVDTALLSEIEEAVAGIDIDAYLPADTLAWCENFLSTKGLNREREDNNIWPFVRFYNDLRAVITLELHNGNPSNLSLLPDDDESRGGLVELKRKLARLGIFPSDAEVEHAVMEADIARGLDERLNTSNTFQEEDVFGVSDDEDDQDNISLEDWRQVNVDDLSDLNEE